MTIKFVWDQLGIRGFRRPLTLLLAVASVFLSQAEAASPYRYRIVDLSATGICVPEAINNLGHVMGSDFSDYTFLWNGVHTVDLGTGPGVFALGRALNDQNAVVGLLKYEFGGNLAMRYEAGVVTDVSGVWADEIAWAINNSGQFITRKSGRSFLRSGETRTDLGNLGYDFSTNAEDINESGQVAGSSTFVRDDRLLNGAFLWDAGRMRNLGTLGGLNSFGHALNDAGMVVGSAQLGDAPFGRRPFVYSAGRMVNLGILLPDPTAKWIGSAEAINNYGVVVGESALPFIWVGGKTFELGSLVDFSGTPFSAPYPIAINDRGEILATASTSLGNRTVLLVPIPTDGVPGHLVNISVRASAGVGEGTCIAGFVVRGEKGGRYFAVSARGWLKWVSLALSQIRGSLCSAAKPRSSTTTIGLHQPTLPTWLQPRAGSVRLRWPMAVRTQHSWLLCRRGLTRCMRSLM